MVSMHERQLLLREVPPEAVWLSRAAREFFKTHYKRDSQDAVFVGTAEKFGILVDELLRLATSQGVDLEEAVWNKYPGVCPYCEQKPCGCGSEKANPHRRLGIPKPQDLSLGDLQRMLGEIYPPAVPATPEMVWQMAVWVENLHEEVWEVVSARKAETAREVQEEFADVFARLMEIASAYGIILED